MLNYGFPQGDGRFRWALADFLSQGYGGEVQPQQLMTTAGASQALDLICTFFARPGDTIFVEEPSYFLALRILQEDHRLNAVPIATDEDGLVPAAVEEALTRHRPVFLYTIPAYQNPTGRTLSRGRRQALLALAEAHDFLIVADEVYHLLDFGTPPPPPFAAHDRQRARAIDRLILEDPGAWPAAGMGTDGAGAGAALCPERAGGQRRRTQPVHIEPGAGGAGEGADRGRTWTACAAHTGSGSKRWTRRCDARSARARRGACPAAASSSG